MAKDLKQVFSTEEKAHATYSASGSHRWLNCPGSISLSENAPEKPESEYAKEGTEAHSCFELLLSNRHKLQNAIKLAYKRFDKSMVEHASDTVNWILDRAGIVSGDTSDNGLEILCETRVDASPFTTEGQFGTLDAAIVQHFGRLIVIDYKYGQGLLVDPEGDDGMGNPQLVYYALGVAHMYDYNFSDVELVVIQPRAYHESGQTIRSHVISMDTLESWIPIFQKGVRRSKKANPAIKPGDWCRFCKAAVVCPELKDKALENAKIAFSDSKGIKSIPEPKMVKLNELGVMLDAAEKLEEWISRLREHALHIQRQGQKIPGWKLVDKRGTRKWSDPLITTAEAARDFGQRAFHAPELLSPAQLEKRLKAEAKNKASRKVIDEWINERVSCESSGTTMVRDSDRRPEASSAASATRAFTTTIDITPKTKTDKVSKHDNEKASQAKIRQRQIVKEKNRHP